jgi:predicted transposase YdaD
VTELGQARRRELDLIARTPTRSGEPELVLVHVELEGRAKPDFPERMCDYYTLLRRRRQMPVLPIVVYITGGRGRRQWEWYRESVLGDVILSFRYRQLRLKSLKAEEAAKSAEPLVCALAVLMDRRGADPAVLKVQSLEHIGRAGLDPLRTWLLANVVESFLPLRAAARKRYEQLLTREEYQMAKQWDYHAWNEHTRAEAMQQGLVRAKREDILTILRARFSPFPDELARQIETISTLSELDALLVRAATANSLDDVRAGLH